MSFSISALRAISTTLSLWTAHLAKLLPFTYQKLVKGAEFTLQIVMFIAIMMITVTNAQKTLFTFYLKLEKCVLALFLIAAYTMITMELAKSAPMDFLLYPILTTFNLNLSINAPV